MEKRKRSMLLFETVLLLGLLVSPPLSVSALSITVNDVECVYEFVLFEGDAVSGNFVVVDHDIFWGYNHPGIDLVVTSPGGNTVHTMNGTSGDKFEFKAPREHLDPINIKIAELREALESVTAEQKYLEAREAHHRYIFRVVDAIFEDIETSTRNSTLLSDFKMEALPALHGKCIQVVKILFEK